MLWNIWIAKLGTVNHFLPMVIRWSIRQEHNSQNSDERFKNLLLLLHNSIIIVCIILEKFSIFSSFMFLFLFFFLLFHFSFFLFSSAWPIGGRNPSNWITSPCRGSQGPGPCAAPAAGAKEIGGKGQETRRRFGPCANPGEGPHGRARKTGRNRPGGAGTASGWEPQVRKLCHSVSLWSSERGKTTQSPVHFPSVNHWSRQWLELGSSVPRLRGSACRFMTSFWMFLRVCGAQSIRTLQSLSLTAPRPPSHC